MTNNNYLLKKYFLQFRVLYKVKSQKLIHQKFINLSQINSDFHANIVFLVNIF